jgi:FlaA1/EpsC-like NDP-sugar epimerase
MTPHPKLHYRNKIVCVTGAGGSIGSEICRKLIQHEVSRLIMVARSEIDLFRIERELRHVAPAGALEPVLGDVCNQKLMQELAGCSNIVIHAAAHKHVPICEENPVEAVMNNVGGTMSLIHACATRGVEQFVTISTDKAVKPASVMGATKRACELFVRFFQPRTSMKMTTVRFGNVLNSSGSVLPIWRQQLREGRKITITDKRCTRFFMSIPEAAELVLQASALARPDNLYVLDMGEPKSIYELAKQTVAEILYPGADCHTPDDHIEEVGLRPGEKLTEELAYGGELIKTIYPGVLKVRENDTGRVLRWADFEDLLMAAKCNAKGVMLEKLWEIVR